MQFIGRNFSDMMKDEVQREFFRRFLIFNGAEAPLHFCNNVNDIKGAKEMRVKQAKIANVMKKYFTSANHGECVILV